MIDARLAFVLEKSKSKLLHAYCVYPTQVEVLVVDQRRRKRARWSRVRASEYGAQAPLRSDKRAVIRHLVRLLGNTTLIHRGEN